MKIEFLSQDDSLYILPFFEEFFRNHAADFEIVSVSLCRVMGKRGRRKLLKELFWLYGGVGLVRVALRMAWLKLMGKFSRQRGAPRYYSIEQLCAAYGVPCRQVANPNDSQFVDSVKQRGPEVLVSVACPHILKAPILSAAPASINIHHAPLPKYKGMMPTFWQMYHGEKKVGLTIHYMVAELDAGDALLQEEMTIEPGESLDRLIRRSKRHGAHCMAKVLKQIESGSATPQPLDNSQSTYFTFPSRDESMAFRQRGLRAI